MKKYLYIIFLSLMQIGCTSVRYVPVESKSDSIVIEKFVPIPIPPDSATIRALLECDENGRVVLGWLDQQTSKNASLLFQLDSLGNMVAKMNTKPDTVYLPSKEVYINRDIKAPYPVEKQLSKWEQIKMDVGGIAIGGLIAVICGIVIWVAISLRKK